MGATSSTLAWQQLAWPSWPTMGLLVASRPPRLWLALTVKEGAAERPDGPVSLVATPSREKTL